MVAEREGKRRKGGGDGEREEKREIMSLYLAMIRSHRSQERDLGSTDPLKLLFITHITWPLYRSIGKQNNIKT